MLPGQPVQDAPSKGTLPTTENRQEEYSKLDHATLVRNLTAVCKELGVLLDSAGLYCGPPALTREDVEENIPYALHKIGVGAGWIEESVEVEDEDSEPGPIDLLGDRMVKESYKEWFLQLVQSTLSDLRVRASANKTAQDQDYQRLLGQFPKGRRPALVKRDWPSKYDDGAETPKGILDRRRKAMHLEWEDLHEKVENEWIRRQLKRRADQGLERAKPLGFSIDSLLSIRRASSHPLPQPKLELVAAVISLDDKGKPIPTPIPWEALRWRDEFVVK
jgi:hypothetical protein